MMADSMFEFNFYTELSCESTSASRSITQWHSDLGTSFASSSYSSVGWPIRDWAGTYL